MEHQPSKASPETLQRAMVDVFAPWVRELNLELVEAHAGEVILTLPVAPRLVFGEIEVLDAQGRLAAHATTTYALL